MSLLSARDLSKAYGARVLFSGLALTISEGDRVGLLGTNGSGKSTLLDVLMGVVAADVGVIDRRRGARVGYLPQEPVLSSGKTAIEIAREGLHDWHEAWTRHAEVTRALESRATNPALAAEQAALGETIEQLGGWERDHVAEAVLGKLGVKDPSRVVGTMSGGERRRVALARLLVSEPDLAVLDEPTNHLDTDAIEWLEETLGAMRGAVLVATHDRYVLDAVSTRIVELDDGVLREFAGDYSSYLEQKAALLEHEARVEQTRVNLVRRESAWLLRGARARTTKQKARIQRARELMSAEAPAPEQTVMLETAAVRTGKTILELHGVDVEVAGKRLVSGLTLHLVGGDRIGVLGPNGAGKTSLLRVIMGNLAPQRGEVTRGKNTKVAYLDQARSGLREDWSVLDNVVGREGAERTGAGMVLLGKDTLDMRTYLERFLFGVQKQRQKVGGLSGGERARVALAKLLKEGSNLLLLDEPTNDLDVATLRALEEMLLAWSGCALIVSHDRAFLDRVATSTLAFERGTAEVTRRGGGYEAYRVARAEAATPVETEKPRTAPARGAVAKKGLTYGERLELERILDDVAAAEEALRSVEAELADPRLYAERSAEVPAVESRRADAARRVAELTARWEWLEERKARRPQSEPI